MAIKIDSWKAEMDGTLFPTERAATEHDMRQLCLSITQGDQVAAEKLHPLLVKHADATVKYLSAYAKCHPKARVDEPEANAPTSPPAAAYEDESMGRDPATGLAPGEMMGAP